MADNNKTELNLDNVDAVVLVDKSGSMGEPYKNGQTRWEAGKESIAALAVQLAAHDDDGITLIPFSDDSRVNIEDGITPDRVEKVFSTYRPGGGTYLAAPLQAAIDRFIPEQREDGTETYTVTESVDVPNPKAGQKKGWFGGTEPATIKEDRQVTKTRQVKGQIKRVSPKKQVFIAVYTDGAASDESAVKAVLVNATKRIKSRSDLGILFIQVGSDSGAKAFLERLNSNLGGDFDIVAVEKLEDLEDFSTEELIKKAFTE